MPHTDLPDVIGWEVPRAQDELRALGIRTILQKCEPPAWQGADTGVAFSLDTTEAVWRVVATRFGAREEVTLVVCPEVW